MTERDYQTRQEEQPEVIPDYVPNSIENNGHGWPTWLKRTVGGAAAAAALAAGIAAGVGATSNHSGPSKEGQRPVATASANPGETVPATPSPTNSTEKNIDSSVFTPDSFTFTGPDGKEYKGAQAFEQSLAIPAPADAPTTTEYTRSVAMEMLSRLHYCATAPTSPNTLAEYGTNHTSETLTLYHDACMAALTASPISALEDDYTNDSEGYMRASTQLGDKAKLTYTVTSLNTMETGDGNVPVIGAWVQETVSRTDPNSPNAPFNEKRVLVMSMNAENGAWKLNNYGPDNGAFTGPAPTENVIG